MSLDEVGKGREGDADELRVSALDALGGDGHGDRQQRDDAAPRHRPVLEQEIANRRQHPTHRDVRLYRRLLPRRR